MNWEGLAFQAVDGLASASGLFFVAAGLSLIFGVTRIINIAHGSLYMLGTYIAVTLATAMNGALGFWGGIVAALWEFTIGKRKYGLSMDATRCCSATFSAGAERTLS
jgi:branched-subunit amino acid ABC-type transport system permease component